MGQRPLGDVEVMVTVRDGLTRVRAVFGLPHRFSRSELRESAPTSVPAGVVLHRKRPDRPLLAGKKAATQSTAGSERGSSMPSPA